MAKELPDIGEKVDVTGVVKGYKTDDSGENVRLVVKVTDSAPVIVDLDGAEIKPYDGGG